MMAYPHHHHRGGEGCWKVLELPFSTCADSLHGHRMIKLSTVPYAHEPGLIAKLLGMVLKAAHAYGVRLLRKI